MKLSITLIFFTLWHFQAFSKAPIDSLPNECLNSGGVWEDGKCTFPSTDRVFSCEEMAVGAERDRCESHSESREEDSEPTCDRRLLRTTQCSAFCSFSNYRNVNDSRCSSYRETVISSIRDELNEACDATKNETNNRCNSFIGSISEAPSISVGSSGSDASCSGADGIRSVVFPSVSQNLSSCQSVVNTCRLSCSVTRTPPWPGAESVVASENCDGLGEELISKFETIRSSQQSLASDYQAQCDSIAGTDDSGPTGDEDFDYSDAASTDQIGGDDSIVGNGDASGIDDTTGEIAGGGSEEGSGIGGAIGKTVGTLAALAPAFMESSGGSDDYGSPYTSYDNSTLDNYGNEEVSYNAGSGNNQTYGQSNTSFGGSKRDPFIPTDGAGRPENPDKGTLAGGPAGGGAGGFGGGGGFGGSGGGAQAAPEQGSRSGRRQALKARNVFQGFKNSRKQGGKKGSQNASKRSPQYMKLAYTKAIKQFGRKTPLKFNGSKYVPDLKAMKASQDFKMRNARAVAMYEGRKSSESGANYNDILLEGGINPNEKHGIFKTMNIFMKHNFPKASHANGLKL